MASSQSPDISSLEAMYSLTEQRVIVRDLTDVELQNTFDTWWDSLKVVTKNKIVWNSSRHASAWRFFKHCANAQTGSPGVICIVCYQVLTHPSENGTSTMGKHLLTKGHKAKLNELTENEVSLLTGKPTEEEALAVLKKKGSHGVMVVSSFPPNKIFSYPANQTSVMNRQKGQKWLTKTSRQLNSTRILGIDI
jgi:hypothetical protein